MGLFDRKKGKPEGEKNEEQIVPKKDGIFPIVTLVIEDVLALTSAEVSVLGNVHGGDIKVGDTMFLLGRSGRSLKTTVRSIQDEMLSKIAVAEENTNASLVLDGLKQGDIVKYDVLSSVNYKRQEEDKPSDVVNPYLTGLLRDVKANDHITNNEYMGRLIEYLVNEAVLITPMMHAPEGGKEEGKIGLALLRNGENTFLPAFTDTYELEQANGINEKLIKPLDFKEAKTIVDNSDCNGLALNPSTEGFVVPKELLDRIEHQKKNIDNNIREQKIDKNEPLMLAIPNEGKEPEELFNAVKEYFAKEPRVQRAWYGIMVHPKSETRKEESQDHLIIVDTLEEDQDIFGAIGRVAKEHLNGMQLNMQTFQRVGENITNHLKLFYERKENITIVK